MSALGDIGASREKHRAYLDRLSGGPSVELLMVRDFDRIHDGRVVQVYRAYGPPGELVPATRLRVEPADDAVYVRIETVPALLGMRFVAPEPMAQTNN